MAQAGCGSGQATPGAGQTEELALKHGRFPELQFSSVCARVWCRQRRGSRSDEAPGREGRGDAAVQHMGKAGPIATSAGEPR